MASPFVDMDHVRHVLRRAVKPIGPDSQRGLAKKAGLDRDAVYDLLQGRNTNPSLRALAALAEAMGEDLSIFGASDRLEAPSVAELERVLLESLPEMPRRGSWERKASFLAEAVASALRLPRDSRSIPPSRARPPRRAPAKAAPPPSATS